jgi:hypothetical protein
VEIKAVGVNPQSQVHFVDHLAPICVLMGVPLLFTDERERQYAAAHYPGLDAQFIPYELLTREHLIKHYDLLFMSDLWDRKAFHERYAELESSYQKVLRHVHCPHGFSDKGYYLRKCGREDILLLYGQNMLDLLKHENVFQELPYYVTAGNFRYTYFKQHRAFFERVYKQEVQPLFAKKQPTILYAPTWKDIEDASSFFEAAHFLFDSLPDAYNMIVKVHPRLESEETAEYYRIEAKYGKKPNLIFLKDFSLVYPLLAHAQIYIGDISSIGYDFLAFNRPMFFLNHQRWDAKSDRRLYLFRTGVELMPEEFPLLYRVIEASLGSDAERFGRVREEVYRYTFGEERSFEQIKADILAAAHLPYKP